jgi:hypothetical protein
LDQPEACQESDEKNSGQPEDKQQKVFPQEGADGRAAKDRQIDGDMAGTGYSGNDQVERSLLPWWSWLS